MIHGHYNVSCKRVLCGTLMLSCHPINSKLDRGNSIVKILIYRKLNKSQKYNRNSIINFQIYLKHN